MTSVTIGSPDLHIEDPDLIGKRWTTGVVLLMVADASFVAALVFSYFYLRGLNTEKAWLAPGQRTAHVWVGWAVAGGTVLSALAFRWAYRSVVAGHVGRLVRGAQLALVLVVADAAGQVVQILTLGFGLNTSAYSSAVYTLAGANLFHLSLTAFIGLAMWNRSRLGIYSAASHWQVRVVSLWWTWVAAASVLGAFATSFVASPNTGR